MKCQIGVSIAIIAAVFFLIFIFCRQRRDCGGKYKSGEMGRHRYPSDYLEEYSSSFNASHGWAHAVALHSVHNFHHNSSHSNGFNINNNNNQELFAELPLEDISIDRKWEFPRNQIIIEQTLGEGEFGKVMKGRANGIDGQVGQTTVAVKMLKSNSTAAELADLLSEYDLLKEVKHPNVVRLLGACTTKGGPIYLIMEYCKYGSLRSYLRRSRHFELESRVGSAAIEDSPGDFQITPKQILSFAWQICKGMAYLGNMKLVHRDLAARNVLLAEGKICKISDFGLTRDVYEGDLYFKRSKGRVPVKWMAIESLVDHVYTSKSDIWGFGVLLWELVTLGSAPYPGVTPERLYALLQSGYRMEKPENCSQELYEIMRNCWNHDPSKRHTFTDLCLIFENMIETDVEYLELRSLLVTNRAYFDDSVLTENVDNSNETKEQTPLSFSENESNEHFPTKGPDVDKDSYLVAVSKNISVEPEEKLKNLRSNVSQNPTSLSLNDAAHIHAHNPAYSPSNSSQTILLSANSSLQYSSLASGGEEDVDIEIIPEGSQENCRSEGESESGRATGDSGYQTEEGRKCHSPKCTTDPLNFSKFKQDSYSPQELENEGIGISEEIVENQSLLTEDILAPPLEFINISLNSKIEHCNDSKNEQDKLSHFTTKTSSEGIFRNKPCLQQKSQRNPVEV